MKDESIQSRLKVIGFRAIRFQLDVRSFEKKKDKPSFELKLKDIVNASENQLVKIFFLKFGTKADEEFVEFMAEFHTVFESTDLSDDFLKSDFARISAPAIGFPFLRAFVANCTLQAGIPPILLPSINFVQFAKESE